MLIYLDELLAEVEDIAEYAKIISDKFEYGYDADSILLDAKGMQKRVDYLCSILPEGVSYGDARRHSGFLVYYLEKGNKRSCQSDIESLLAFDLPGVAKCLTESFRA